MTTAPQSLPEFLLAMIAADEVVAKAASGPRWQAVDPDAGTPQAGRFGHVITGGMYPTAWPDDATHIARHDPARVLAQCAAYRAIVEMHDEAVGNCMDGYIPGLTHGDVIRSQSVNGVDNGYCDTLRALASIWSAHPDFDKAWAL